MSTTVRSRLVRTTALFAAALLSSAPRFCRAELSETSEARYLAGLRERRLFSLAESYCRRRLADAYVLDRRRTELTIELSRTSLEAALFAKSPERDAHFAQASQVLEEELRRKPNGAWRAALLVQRGLVERAHDAADGRAVRVRLTAAGRALQQAVGRAHARSVSRAVGQALDADEMRELERLCRRLIEHRRSSTDERGTA